MPEKSEYYPALAPEASEPERERTLITSCARTELFPEERKRVSGLLDSRIAWSRFLRLVDLYQVGPLVYHNLLSFENIPDNITEALREETARVFVSNTNALKRVAGISPAFRESGTRAIFMKGAAFLVDVYKDPAFRTFADVDILVDDIEKADKALTGAGFTSCDERADSDYRAQRLYADGTGLYIDVHTDLTGRRSHSRITGLDIDVLWPAKREVTGCGVTLDVMGIEHSLLYHCMHLSTQHGFGDLRWYVDINEFIRVHGGELDWNGLVGDAFRHHVAKPLNYCLQFTRKLLGADIPEGVMSELSRTESPRDKWLFRKIRDNDSGVDYLAELFMFDSLWDTFRFAAMLPVKHPRLLGHFAGVFGKAARQAFGGRKS